MEDLTYTITANPNTTTTLNEGYEVNITFNTDELFTLTDTELKEDAELRI
jgi:hypothetical protein